MGEQFALWLTIVMTGVLLIGVTWIFTDRIVELRHRVNKLEIYRRLDEDEKFCEKPTKREWIGLTDEEIKEIEIMYYHDKLYDIADLCREVEKRLMKKNIGGNNV